MLYTVRSVGVAIGLWAGCGLAGMCLAQSLEAAAAEKPHPLLTWVKQHPREGSAKPSPRMGYETSYGYDPLRKLLIRYGGHNQGGGGEQNSETWTYDLATDTWTLKEPNDAPPGVCCTQQNVYDELLRKFLRFRSFSGSHGWQSYREIALKDSSVWAYDLDSNTWRAMRPCPEVWPHGLRGAAYDPIRGVTVIHGGEGAGHGTVVYDLYTNTWHELKPSGPPPEGGPARNLSQPGFCYDGSRFILFGSQFADDNRTWVYDLDANQWSILPVKEHPPADKSSPVLAADIRNGVVLCSVLGKQGHETWVLDPDKPEWRRINVPQEPDYSGARNRILLYLPDENLFVLENRTKDEQQIWTFRYAEAPPPAKARWLPGPQNLRALTTQQGVKLSWQPPPGVSSAEYQVQRWVAAKPWGPAERMTVATTTGTELEDTKVEAGKLYLYQVIATGADGVPRRSAVVRAQPPVVLDVLCSVPQATRIELSWKSPAEDVVGYHVERADVAVDSASQVARIANQYPQASEWAVGRIRSIGRFQRLTAAPLGQTRFVDTTVDLSAGQREPEGPLSLHRPLRDDQLAPGKPYRFAVYAYRVIAVNRLGVESGPSPLVFTYPSAVQHVFAKEEEEGKTRLKWQPHPAAGIKGYYVYRFNGRWDKDPIVRLTPEPIQATEYLDEQSGQVTRRYEIVAVDALGQEGEPSQPVWSRREWRRYYVPFVGQWHQ